MTTKNANSQKRDYVAGVREFNRFYTRRIGALQEKLLESAYSLTELRIMYELLHRNAKTASELAHRLGINRGYVSRILKRFKFSGLIERSRSAADRRELLLRLTRKGRCAYAPLNRRASAEVEQLLEPLTDEEAGKLLDAMHTIRQLLEAGYQRQGLFFGGYVADAVVPRSKESA
jgi:DNA-binding MarR family transcriptional regulator